MGYTCFSTADKGCGSFHRTQVKAKACCSIHAEKFGEQREPRPFNTASEALEACPPSDEAVARKEAWRAARKDGRKGYDITDNAVVSSLEVTAKATGFDAKPDVPAPAIPAMDPSMELAATLDPMAVLAKGIAPHLRSMDFGSSKVSDDDIDKAMLEAEKRIQQRAIDSERRIKADFKQQLAEKQQVEIIVKSPAQPKGKKINGHAHPRLETLVRVIGAGEAAFLSGPAGSGKTTAAQQVADALDMELVIQPVANDKFDAMGFIDAAGAYRESAVYRWARSKKPALLLLDEIDAWNPHALTALNPVLDNRIGIFPGGQQFEISSEHRVISTANTWGTGADAAYCGRNRLDAASLDRFGVFLEWGYDEALEGSIVAGIVGTEKGKQVHGRSLRVRKALQRNGVRDIVWGPRQSIGLARRIDAGFTMDEALELSALATLQPSTRKAVLAA